MPLKSSSPQVMAFLDSLPLEFPDEFPQYWAAQNGDWRAKARLDRKDLEDAEITHKKVSDEGFEGYIDNTCRVPGALTNSIKDLYDRTEDAGVEYDSE